MQTRTGAPKIETPPDEETARPEHFAGGAPVPALWLFGKAQSGKTSIVRYLTGADDAVIGNGFRPETKATFSYTFPTQSMPVLRFYDTRGLGEESYHPAEDIQTLQREAHAVIVSARVNDFAQASVIDPLKKIRASRRTRPVILALTCLHNLYPQAQHPSPDPFFDNDLSRLPDELQRCIGEQARLFDKLVDRVVPIDLTKPEDGFNDPHFGGGRLKEAIIDLLPDALGLAVRDTDDTLSELRRDLDARALRYVRSYAGVTAGIGAIPIPWIDIPAVTGVQLRMVAKLANVYEQSPMPPTLVTGLPVLGSRFLLRQGAKQLLKGVPLLGIPVNAATAFATTIGIGRAAMWYYWQRLLGHIPSSDEFQHMVGRQVETARKHWDPPKRPSTEESRD